MSLTALDLMPPRVAIHWTNTHLDGTVQAHVTLTTGSGRSFELVCHCDPASHVMTMAVPDGLADVDPAMQEYLDYWGRSLAAVLIGERPLHATRREAAACRRRI